VPHVTGSRPDRIARDAEPDGEENRIEEMYRLLLELRDGTTPTPRMPEALRPVYRELCRREVPAAVVRKLCADLPAELRSGRSSIRRPALHAALGGVFRVQGHPAGARQRVMALVGPTGVGKTTTIAKLAGQCRQTGGLRPALVSLDTYRIGATAQMQIYAELLGAPLHVVRTPSEFADALRAEAAADVVLVDSTGRSPQHREGIQALRTFLQEIPHPEIHLVVSATTKASDLEEILRRFRPVRYQHLLITKLDEAQSPGPVLGLALQENLSISYLATGQEVPDDLELATPQRLASFLLPSRRGGGSRALAGA
jgi:flagellar biosynthesis protein FlhF